MEDSQSPTKIKRHIENNSARLEQMEEKEELANKKEEIKEQKEEDKIEEQEQEQQPDIMGEVNVEDLIGLPIMSYGAVLTQFLDYPPERFEIYRNGIISNAKLVLAKHGVNTAEMTPELALALYSLLPLGEAGMLKVIKKIKPKSEKAKQLRDNLLKQLGMEATDGDKK